MQTFFCQLSCILVNLRTWDSNVFSAKKINRGPNWYFDFILIQTILFIRWKIFVLGFGLLTLPLSGKLMQAAACNILEDHPDKFRCPVCRTYFKAIPDLMGHLRDVHFWPVFGSNFHAFDRNCPFCEEMKMGQGLKQQRVHFRLCDEVVEIPAAIEHENTSSTSRLEQLLGENIDENFPFIDDEGESSWHTFKQSKLSIFSGHQ